MPRTTQLTFSKCEFTTTHLYTDRIILAISEFNLKLSKLLHSEQTTDKNKALKLFNSMMYHTFKLIVENIVILRFNNILILVDNTEN